MKAMCIQRCLYRTGRGEDRYRRQGSLGRIRLHRLAKKGEGGLRTYRPLDSINVDTTSAEVGTVPREFRRC